jgi:hypothetical protein
MFLCTRTARRPSTRWNEFVPRSQLMIDGSLIMMLGSASAAGQVNVRRQRAPRDEVVKR